MAATAADSVCVDQRCACHADPARKVVTPFPLEAGPPYCCNLCASSREYVALILQLAELERQRPDRKDATNFRLENITPPGRSAAEPAS